MKRTGQGFTLVELAVVLVIMGTMLTLGLAAFNAQMTTGAYAKTRVKMDVIKDALFDHLGRHMYLPCPDQDGTAATGADGSGEDDRATPGDPTTDCNGYFGVVPYRDLGLGREGALDGWDNYFSYHVSHDNANSLKRWTKTDAVRPASDGVLYLRDAAPPAGNVLADKLVVILVSHGQNGLGAYTVKGVLNAPPSSTASPDENANTADGDVTYVKRDYSDRTGGGGPFDDLILSLSATELLGTPVRSGAILSPQAELQRAYDEADGSVLSQMINGRSGTKSANDCSFPIPASGSLPQADPWARSIRLQQGTSATLSSTSLPVPAYTLRSYGLDDTQGTADDPPARATSGAILWLTLANFCAP